MDIVNLIRAVRCREPIWNRQHPQYKDRDASLTLWTEVANETGVDVETARCKWRGLRDTFRVQLRKLHQFEKNGAPIPLTWEYFDEMVFVKDQIYIDVHRKKYSARDRFYGEWDSKGGGREKDDDDSLSDDSKKPNGGSLLQVEYPLRSAIEHAIRLKMEEPQSASTYGGGDDTSEEESEYKTPAELCVAEVTEDTETRLEFDTAANRTVGVPSSDDDLTLIDRSASVPLLQKKLRALQDDNYCFLMSLLPQLKSLPIKQKLFVRLKIQELLYTEIMKMEKNK